MSLIDRPAGRSRLSAESLFIFGAPVLWLALYNFRFWEASATAMWRPSLGSAAFMVSLFILAALAQTLLLVLLPRVLLKPVACAAFIVAALVAYFSDSFGVYMDKDMLRNVFATETAEVAGLISFKLIAYFVLLGLLPCVLIYKLPLARIGWRQRFKERAGLMALVLMLSLAGLFALSPAYASFFREHKPIRYLLNPVSAVYNSAELLIKQHSRREPATVVQMGGPVTRVAPATDKPLMMFLVVGETARAGNFQLDGYPRPTNPELSRLDDLIYFKNARSCGTATETSLPCIFSGLGREHFDIDDAKHQTNLLDLLAQAGFDVQWRDNNTGCKGVCARIEHIEYHPDNVPNCHTQYCHDENMASDLPGLLEGLKHDSVIVFHQIGSHGPAYWERYPPQFERFKPACQSTQLDRCAREAVVNAYDNTIAYTDHNLARQIELLRQASDRVDSLLVYVSDHGESLGEHGVYLHGMPYSIAPDNQKQVPLMVWMSSGYQQRSGIDAACLRAKVEAPLSHDNIFHSVMGALGVRNGLYQESLDIFATCRKPALASH